MKNKTARLVLVMVCIFALCASLCGSAFAAEEYDLETVAAMAQKALDQQAIQNVMSRHVMYHCYGTHRDEMLDIWVQEPENQATASFGQNQGFYVGYGSIWDAYVEGHDSSWLTSAKKYLDNNNIDYSGMTDEEILEVYGGVGQLLLHVTTTAIIEVAEDGQTAKCFWYSPGMIAESGQSGNTIWEAYGVDFVKEDGEWKMWHLHMFTDFMGSFYLTLGGSNGGSGEASTNNAQQEWKGEEGSQLAKSDDFTTEAEYDPSTTHDYLSSTQYSEFSSSRLRSDMELFIPTAYESWDFADENYGPTKEEYESFGIDLDAWYEAHGGAPAAEAEAPAAETEAPAAETSGEAMTMEDGSTPPDPPADLAEGEEPPGGFGGID